MRKDVQTMKGKAPSIKFPMERLEQVFARYRRAEVRIAWPMGGRLIAFRVIPVHFDVDPSESPVVFIAVSQEPPVDALQRAVMDFAARLGARFVRQTVFAPRNDRDIVKYFGRRPEAYVLARLNGFVLWNFMVQQGAKVTRPPYRLPRPIRPRTNRRVSRRISFYQVTEKDPL